VFLIRFDHADKLATCYQKHAVTWPDTQIGSVNGACAAACTGLRPPSAPGIAEIHDTLTARIAEAEREGWHGEAEGLKISLAGARDKLAQIDRRSRPADPVNVGMPAFASEVLHAGGQK